MTETALTAPTGATTSSLPERVLRSILLGLAHRRWLGRLATSTPFTRPMVARFVAGTNIDEVVAATKVLQARGFATTMDVLGESVATPDEARAAADRYLKLLDAIVANGLERNVSLKLTQMGLDLGHDLCTDTVGRIMRKAEEIGAFVRIDMEQHTKTDATLAILREVRAIHPDTGVVIQAALRRSMDDVAALNAEGCAIRLCKGAYKEPASVAYPDKPDVDAAYARLLEAMLTSGTRPALATHDPRLINHAIAFAKANGIDRDRFEFQMLYGVRRDLQDQLLADGYRVRIYVPFGAEWYPYFMRRLAERPANVAFILKSLFREDGKGSKASPKA